MLSKQSPFPTGAEVYHVFRPALPRARAYPSDAIPLANALIVVLNVLAFSLGFSGGWYVGPGTGTLSVVTYAFAHASPWHLAGNMWILLVFGNPVNRRLGNAFYTLVYLATVLWRWGFCAAALWRLPDGFVGAPFSRSWRSSCS